MVEISVERNAANLTDQAKRNPQTALSTSLNHIPEFDVYDTRHTRNASQADLAAINGAAAVRVGKQLNVAYVLIGTVTEYDTQGSATIKTRLVEVATGKVNHSGETAQQATMKMNPNASAVEMQAKVMKAAIDKMTATITAGF